MKAGLIIDLVLAEVGRRFSRRLPGRGRGQRLRGQRWCGHRWCGRCSAYRRLRGIDVIANAAADWHPVALGIHALHERAVVALLDRAGRVTFRALAELVL